MLKSVISNLRNGKIPPDYETERFEILEIMKIIPQNVWTNLESLTLVTEDNSLALQKVNYFVTTALTCHNPQMLSTSEWKTSGAILTKGLITHLLSIIDEHTILKDPIRSADNVHFIGVSESEKCVLTNENFETEFMKASFLSSLPLIFPRHTLRWLREALLNYYFCCIKDLSNKQFEGQDIFYRDLCPSCQTRLLRKYHSQRISIPAKAKYLKEYFFCYAYAIGLWFRLFRNMDSYCKYASRVGEEYKRAVTKLGLKIDYIDQSAIRKIIEKNLEKDDIKFLEMHTT